MPDAAHEYTLKRRGLDALVVVVVPLTCSQMLTAMKAPDTATAKNDQVEAAAINLEILRMSVRAIDGACVDYSMLEGKELQARLGRRTRHLISLVTATVGLYSPSRDEVDAIKGGAANSEDEDLNEVWVVTLPDGRKVEMEHTSFSDPGPDESRVLIDGIKLCTIPGY